VSGQRFRKRPVVVDAVRFIEEEPDEAFSFVEAGGGTMFWYSEHEAAIVTLEGNMLVNPGDWIIKGVKGELYSCKPDIFEATYEAVSS
jgi:hypothetical protein